MVNLQKLIFVFSYNATTKTEPRKSKQKKHKKNADLTLKLCRMEWRWGQALTVWWICGTICGTGPPSQNADAEDHHHDPPILQHLPLSLPLSHSPSPKFSYPLSYFFWTDCCILYSNICSQRSRKAGRHELPEESKATESQKAIY